MTDSTGMAASAPPIDMWCPVAPVRRHSRTPRNVCPTVFAAPPGTSPRAHPIEIYRSEPTVIPGPPPGRGRVPVTGTGR
ncbi:hypothetical protein GCM10010177_06190 [Actinomadura citrea]|nr:hypothetical protein GCM10010177_06190 [Actinomadura citrea]